MDLYRGQSDPPEFSSPALEQELYLLEKERDEGPPDEYMVQAFQRMGRDKYVRLVELRGIVKDQIFFSDSRALALQSGGEHPYLVTISVPDEIAWKHKVIPEEVGAVGEHPVSGAQNFAFVGTELAEHKLDWNIRFENPLR